MPKFKLVLPLVAASALICTFAVQAAGGRDSAAATAPLAVASVAVAGAACQPAGSCSSAAQVAANTSSEPSNYALMAAALGVVGFVASRRRQQF